MMILLVLGVSGRITSSARKRRDNRLNTVALCLSFLSTVINVAVTSIGNRNNLHP